MDVPPASTSGAVNTLSPPVWKSGALRSVTSAPERPQLVFVLTALAVTERYVKMAPLGVPVVPPVPQMIHGSSQPRSTGGAGPSLARSRSPKSTSLPWARVPPASVTHEGAGKSPEVCSAAAVSAISGP
jgi:hypothetical protein